MQQILLLCIYFVVSPCFGDYYSSLLNAEKLIDIEEQILNGLEDNVESADTLLEQCERAIDVWEANHLRDMTDPSEFVKVPTNGFKLIKRNTVDFDLIAEKFLKSSLSDFLNVSEVLAELPTETDLYETTWALAKLSFVYDLDFQSMLIDGELSLGNEVVYHRPLRGDERILFFQQLFSNMFNIDNYFSEEIFEFLKDAMADVSRESKEVGDRIIPYFVKMITKLNDFQNPYYLHYLVKNVRFMFEGNDQLNDLGQEVENRIQEILYVDQNKTLKFQKLCRGLGERDPKVLSQLKCYYKRQSRSLFLLIIPLKVEQLNLEPEILLFHEILTENQMEALKNSAKQNFTRSMVLQHQDSKAAEKLKISRIRLTHSSKLRNASATAEVESATVEATGLNPDGFEHFSVNIYGVGGYYVYHMDSGEIVDKKRAATMLYYLSDVQMGGATIFPTFNLTVQPRAGSAIFWYNVHASGELDYRMIHSSCPVLLGQKWIGTYWIRHLWQTFHRPCIPGELETSPDQFTQEHCVIPELQQQ